MSWDVRVVMISSGVESRENCAIFCFIHYMGSLKNIIRFGTWHNFNHQALSLSDPGDLLPAPPAI